MFRLKPQRATESATDNKIGGNHYKSKKGHIQPIELIVAHDLDYIEVNYEEYAVIKK